MKLTTNPLVVTGVANSQPIPVDTRETGTFAFNIVPSAGNTTLAAQLYYTLDDVYAAGYTGSTAPYTTGNWISVGAAITYNSGKPTVVQLTGSNAVLATAFQLQVTTSTGSVSIQGWQNVTSIT